MQLCQLSAAWKIWVNSREEAAASAMGTGFCARSRKDDLFAVYDRETSPQRDAISGRQRIPRMNRNTLFESETTTVPNGDFVVEFKAFSFPMAIRASGLACRRRPTTSGSKAATRNPKVDCCRELQSDRKDVAKLVAVSDSRAFTHTLVQESDLNGVVWRPAILGESASAVTTDIPGERDFANGWFIQARQFQSDPR